MRYERVCADGLSLSEAELSARLKMPVGALPENFSKCREALFSASSPAFVSERMKISSISENVTEIGGTPFESVALARVLSGCGEALLLSATLGVGAERLLRKYSSISPSMHFVTDAIADALVEALCDKAEEFILTEEEHTARFSPGYSDLPLSYVKEIFRMTDAERLLGVRLTDGYLATPSKTVTAIIGIKTKEDTTDEK